VNLSTSTRIYHIFIDTTRNGEYDKCPFMNGLSDHDAQVLILHMAQKWRQQHYTYMKWGINDDTIANFQAQLSHDLWESVFDEKDVNKSFDLF
jgi:hypothetical protein